MKSRRIDNYNEIPRTKGVYLFSKKDTDEIVFIDKAIGNETLRQKVLSELTETSHIHQKISKQFGIESGQMTQDYIKNHYKIVVVTIDVNSYDIKFNERLFGSKNQENNMESEIIQSLVDKFLVRYNPVYN